MSLIPGSGRSPGGENGDPLQYSHLRKQKMLALWEKNLDSILKRRDITWPTKVHIVKAMVFAVVMYGCESWTIN